MSPTPRQRRQRWPEPGGVRTGRRDELDQFVERALGGVTAEPSDRANVSRSTPTRSNERPSAGLAPCSRRSSVAPSSATAGCVVHVDRDVGADVHLGLLLQLTLGRVSERVRRGEAAGASADCDARWQPAAAPRAPPGANRAGRSRERRRPSAGAGAPRTTAPSAERDERQEREQREAERQQRSAPRLDAERPDATVAVERAERPHSERSEGNDDDRRPRAAAPDTAPPAIDRVVGDDGDHRGHDRDAGEHCDHDRQDAVSAPPPVRTAMTDRTTARPGRRARRPTPRRPTAPRSPRWRHRRRCAREAARGPPAAAAQVAGRAPAAPPRPQHHRHGDDRCEQHGSKRSLHGRGHRLGASTMRPSSLESRCGNVSPNPLDPRVAGSDERGVRIPCLRERQRLAVTRYSSVAVPPYAAIVSGEAIADGGGGSPSTVGRKKSSHPHQ